MIHDALFLTLSPHHFATVVRYPVGAESKPCVLMLLQIYTTLLKNRDLFRTAEVSDWSDLLAPLVKAVQEQQTQIDALFTQNEGQQKEIAQLKKLISLSVSTSKI
jgi:hypothetical protein